MYMAHEKKEPIALMRDCHAIQIPEGMGFILDKGTKVEITQTLGGMFTVELENGMLARIDGKDAEALGHEIPHDRVLSEAEIENNSTEDLVWMKLKTCYDPEIPVNVVDLGLIYTCNVILLDDETYKVIVEMTLTAPGCGMGEVLKGDVERSISEIPGVSSVIVDLVFDPPWESSMMSEEARLQLGML